jgi:carbon monoxide dehydrogenase subunit G
MRISTQATAAAPRDVVMERIMDEEAFAERARARGVEVEKTGLDAWLVRHVLLGIRRETRVRLAERMPDRLRIETDTGGIASRTEVRLLSAGAGTRIVTDTRVEASGIAGRLALKALQPARGEIERRVQAGVRSFAEEFRG